MIHICIKAHQNATQSVNDTISSVRNMTYCPTSTHPQYVQLARITSISFVTIGTGATCCFPAPFSAVASTFFLPAATLTLGTEPTICCLCVKELLVKSPEQIQAPQESTVLIFPNYTTRYGATALDLLIGPPNPN